MCTAPYLKKKDIIRADDLATDYIPCGKCHECQTAKVNQWFVRMKYELKHAVSAYFVTLTYANPPISHNGYYTGSKKHVKKFTKSLQHYEAVYAKVPGQKRKKKQYNTELKYYGCLEYGSTYQRPHYHFLLFNIRDPRSIMKAWTINEQPVGTVHIGDLEDASIRYVTGYVNKKIGIGNDDDDDRLPEFSVMSKGIGESYLKEAHNFHYVNEVPYMVVDGHKYVMPRYYKNKIWPLYKVRTELADGSIKTKFIQPGAQKRIGKKALHAAAKSREQKRSINPNYDLDKMEYDSHHDLNKFSKKSKFS